MSHLLSVLVCVCLTLLLLAVPARSQDIRLGDGISRFPDQALSTFGFIAIPNDSASGLSLKSKSNDEERYLSFQVGGGFRVHENVPLYLEGYLGFQRYDPTLVLGRPSGDLIIPVRWNGAAATGGVGYDWKLDEHWSLRPIVNVSLGHIASDAAILGSLVSDALDVDTEFLIDGGMTTGGVGGSLLLAYKKRSPKADIDIRFRHTNLRLYSILGSADLNAKAKAVSTSAWTRLRFPIGNWQWQNRPIRSVWEASLTHYAGDQGRILDLDWLGKVGAGLELDVSGTNFSFVSRGRLMVHYLFGEEYDGLAMGVGISF
ncbi:hypothetical protein [Primorskyibacter sp. S87]|uniref:hypothetical protein n=1 Tax=Primorskyibacter sp. S87 TaxID=3415126 RepID=UPI003C7D6138